MRTSERKNLKRVKALRALQVKDPEQFEAEKTRLLCAWRDEAWRRVKNRDLPSASALIKIASQFGLGAEMAVEVIEAVQKGLCGPAFISRSVVRPKKGR